MVCHDTNLSADRIFTLKLRLKKPDKLRFKKEFDFVRENGGKQVGPGMVVSYAFPGDQQLKCGVICGKKYSLLAVKRNRARRILWESFRLLRPHIAPCNLVLIPRMRMERYLRQTATRELAMLLVKAGLLPDSVAESPPEC